eukprot:CAMPEP_0118991406 /NCGR_PEP_ID=MMETSP1173-20130426/51596_1 /TAXON_ID=1034831 /ORGANISM="Rhizochromulina marina cf, Strain CCMP1243" /LENGTH=127 /DNA_ID=CAMNT_0006942529 /DNA_START=27 /DNA_END=407 /DNA_ORIENTATION=-
MLSVDASDAFWLHTPGIATFVAVDGKAVFLWDKGALNSRKVPLQLPVQSCWAMSDRLRYMTGHGPLLYSVVSKPSVPWSETQETLRFSGARNVTLDLENPRQFVMQPGEAVLDVLEQPIDTLPREDK